MLLIAAVYVALRCAAFVDVSPYVSPDSATFKEVARHDIFSLSFLAGLRPWTTPLLYKVFTGDSARIWAQFVISLLAWLCLAKTVADMVSERIRPFAFALVLVPSLAVQISLWDSTILSESLAVSFTVLWMAAWLRVLRDPTRRGVAVVLVITVFWVFTRDTHGYVAAVLGAVLLLTLVRGGGRSTRAALGAGCLAAGLLSILSANQSYTVTFSRTADSSVAPPTSSIDARQVGRWEFPLINVIDSRILTDSDRRAWFESRGMPVDPVLMRFAGLEAGAAGFEQFTSSRLMAFRQWLESKGQGQYYEYLLTHPLYLVKPFATGSALKAFVAPDVTSYQPHARRVLPQPLQDLVFPERRRVHGALDKALAAVGFAALLASFVVGFFLLIRAPKDPVSYFVPALFVALCAEALGAWQGDAAELERHSMTVAVMIHVGAAIALVLGLDAYLERRRRRATPP